MAHINGDHKALQGGVIARVIIVYNDLREDFLELRAVSLVSDTTANGIQPTWPAVRRADITPWSYLHDESVAVHPSM